MFESGPTVRKVGGKESMKLENTPPFSALKSAQIGASLLVTQVRSLGSDSAWVVQVRHIHRSSVVNVFNLNMCVLTRNKNIF